MKGKVRPNCIAALRKWKDSTQLKTYVYDLDWNFIEEFESADKCRQCYGNCVDYFYQIKTKPNYKPRKFHYTHKKLTEQQIYEKRNTKD